MQALAEFHVAVERSLVEKLPAAGAPGISRRPMQLQKLIDGGFLELQKPGVGESRSLA